MKNLPLVSIFVPIYNTGEYVVEALNSIVQQNYPNIECYVVDDFSSDSSKVCVKKWIKDNNFHCYFVEHLENKGLAHSLNEFLDWASGEFFTFIGDDLWMPNKLFKQVTALNQAGLCCALVYSDMMNIDEEGKLVADSFLKSKGWENVVQMPTGKVSLVKYMEKAFIPAPSVMLRTSCVRAVGNYDASLYTEDVDMWVKLLLRFEIAYIPEVLVKYRIRSNSMSNDKSNVWKVHQTHMFIWPKYLGSLEGMEKDALIRKILKVIIQYYRSTDDKKLCLNVICDVKEHTKALVWDILYQYIRLGLPKRYIGYFTFWK